MRHKRKFGYKSIGRKTRLQPTAKRRAVVQASHLKAGMVMTIPVAREAEFGYFLKDRDQEVLLHRNEATRPLQVGDEVEVFLYHDHENRLAATMELPIVDMQTYDWLEVVDVSPKLGVFLHNGTKKDLLLFVDDLPKLREEWPQKGDKVCVTLKRDKHGRLLAEPASEEIMIEASTPADKDMMNKKVEGTVYKVLGIGALLYTRDDHIVFIHRDEMTEPLRLGQTVVCRISYVREDGRMNGSMRERKEVQYGEDAERILAYLKERDGAMPYSDESAPEDIKAKFGMSKSAFKRALGKLLKDGLIEQDEGWTHLRRETHQATQNEL